MVQQTDVNENDFPFRRVADSLPVMVWTSDANGNATYVNTSWLDFTGRTLEQELDHGWMEGILANDQPGFSKIFSEALSARVTYTAEYRLRRSDGEYRWILEQGVPRFDSLGESLGFIGTCIDITDRKQAEESERAQRVLAEALCDTVGALTKTLDLDVLMDGILKTVGRVVPHDAANIMTLDGTLVRVTHTRGYDVAAEARLKERHFSLDFPYLRQMIETGQARLIMDVRGDPNWIEVAETAWIRSSIATPIQAHGQVIGFLHLDSATPNHFTAQDIEVLEAFANQAAIAIENAQLYEETRRSNIELERRVAERTAELKYAKEWAEAILNHDRDAILVLNPDGVIRQANQAFEEWLGYGAGFGRTIFALADESSRELLNRVFQDVVTNNHPRRVELVSRTTYGEAIDADMILSPIAGEEQRVQHVVCSLRDISDHKRLEAELRNTLLKERELNAFQARFINEMSHEFRTPLAKILTSRDILKMYSNKLTDEQKSERLDQIQREVKAMVLLLDSLLTVGESASSKEVG
jgi:PAS domain S-box-containing protein